MKTIVLLFAKEFPKSSEKTLFAEKVKQRVKTTTIRSIPTKNPNKWCDIEDELNKGKAFISLRYWSGKPYRSKQVEFAKCYEIEVKKIILGIHTTHTSLQVCIDDNIITDRQKFLFIENEGFGCGSESESKLLEWFEGLKEHFSGVLIKFKDLDF